MTEPILEEHYGENVWTNKKTDEIRKTECLCFNCDEKHCHIASKLYEQCKQFNLALMVTRCKQFKPKLGG